MEDMDYELADLIDVREYITCRLNGLADYLQLQQCIIATSRTVDLDSIRSKGLSDGIRF